MNERAAGWGFVGAQVMLLGLFVVIPGAQHWPQNGVIDAAGRIALLAGLAVVVLAATSLGSALTPTPMPKQHAGLRTGGLYRWVRHPIYSGVLLVVVGSVTSSRSFWKLAVGGCVWIFFGVKSRWEERRLRTAYSGYNTYAQRTPRFFPRLSRR
jgi:protein-S-isoprenylcysteine O-methyltransferase Ste14